MPTDEERHIASLAASGRRLSQPAGLSSLLAGVARLAVETVPDCDAATAFIVGKGVPLTSAASSDQASTADQIQRVANEGPAVLVLTADDAVTTGDLTSDDRWPAIAGSWQALGFASAFAWPLVPASQEATTRGGVVLYSSLPDAFAGSANVATVFAAQATLALRNAVIELQGAVHEAQLREAIETRDLIGQAKGILMAREGCSPDEAFDMLRRASQRENMKLRDIATRIVSAHLAERGTITG